MIVIRNIKSKLLDISTDKMNVIFVLLMSLKFHQGFVAVCFPATLKNTKIRRFIDAPMSRLLIPSLKKTAPDARIYVGIDDDDTKLLKFKNKIKKFATVVIATNKKNRIPFNEITKRAYEDGAEYIVRVNGKF